MHRSWPIHQLLSQHCDLIRYTMLYVFRCLQLFQFAGSSLKASCPWICAICLPGNFRRDINSQLHYCFVAWWVRGATLTARLVSCIRAGVHVLQVNLCSGRLRSKTAFMKLPLGQAHRNCHLVTYPSALRCYAHTRRIYSL